MLNKRVLVATVISLIIISSAVLYSFYIPNNDVLVNKNVNYKTNANILSNNKTNLFIINMTLINVPTGRLHINTLVNSSIINNVNSTIKNLGIYNGTSVVTYSAILSRDITYNTEGININYTQKDNFTLGGLGYGNGIFLRNGGNASYYQSVPLSIPVKSNNIYTLSFIISETNWLNGVKNPHNYSYYLKFTLNKIFIVDHTHGYYHNFYFVNGKNHFTSPKIKITSITT